MNAILLPIKPEHVVNILNGKKTIEIRKYIPKCVPCEVLIYCCKAPQTLLEVIDIDEEIYGDYRNDTGKKIFVKNYKYWFINIKCVDGKIRNVVLDLCGKVVAKFTLNTFDDLSKYADRFKDNFFYETLEKACVNTEYLQRYTHNKPTLYAWHIDNLVIFDKPKELSEYGVKRAPQKYCYLKGE